MIPDERAPRWKSWLAGAGGGLALVATIALLGLLLVLPTLWDEKGDAKSASAGRNLKKIWAAQQFWAAANDGKYVEFRMSRDAREDPGWRRLEIDLGEEVHHAYEARVHDGELWLTARGNLDRDASIDDWELSSIDGEARQVYDDVRNIYLHVLYYERLKRSHRGPNADLSLPQREEALEIRRMLADTRGHAAPSGP